MHQISHDNPYHLILFDMTIVIISTCITTIAMRIVTRDFGPQVGVQMGISSITLLIDMFCQLLHIVMCIAI